MQQNIGLVLAEKIQQLNNLEVEKREQNKIFADDINKLRKEIDQLSYNITTNQVKIVFPVEHAPDESEKSEAL